MNFLLKPLQRLSLIFLITIPVLSQAQNLLPVAARGPYTVATGEYKFPSQVIKDILTDRETEIWARVFWPKDSVTGEIPSDLPLIAFLHGNHSTCGYGFEPRIDYGNEYTSTGKCPEGNVVVPNHEGYNYIAEELASYGYVVFSINANRGITAGAGTTSDSGLNLARGKLILKHFEYWNRWVTLGGAPLSLNGDSQLFFNKINFSYAGLMGHSRGGEGARAAYTLYNEASSFWAQRIPHLKIQAIFEIGAVDGQTSRVLDAQNTVWNQLIPVCDGDVSNFAGIGPYNRMVQATGISDSAQKSVYLVYGANHNFFNTEWQESDSGGCFNHNPLWGKKDWTSPAQKEIAKKIMTDFFRQYVKPSLTFKIQDALNPLSAVDSSITSLTQIERDFSVNPGANIQLRFDDFTLSSLDLKRESSKGLTSLIQTGNLYLQNQMYLSWNRKTVADIFNLKLERKTAVDVSEMKTLDFRLSLTPESKLTTPINFLIYLVDESGAKTNAVQLTDYVTKLYNPFYGPLFQTVRIPLNQFSGIDVSRLKSIEFDFLSPESAEMYLAHVRFSKQEFSWASMAQVPEQPLIPTQLGSTPLSYKILSQLDDPSPPAATVSSLELNKIVKVELINAHLGDAQTAVAITLMSNKRFKIKNAMPILTIGDRNYNISMIKNEKDLSTITFYLPLYEFMSIRSLSTPLKVYYTENKNDLWVFENNLAELFKE